ncbi:MFS family permease [Kitasatospora gansuensis]|uniref:MFS family permease n=1 Tax=Kitasatospora gansuensis TaxID=258050 RepID=A0A7W7WF47_9ACTN|nr:MFS transporter [Kitasatospora gansuensis]MBB4944563.1 MFS family permease [Kitasatospora gansuensis]
MTTAPPDATRPTPDHRPAPERRAAPEPRPTLRQLVGACGGPRYALALAVDALGTGLLRPFLLLYGITVLELSAAATGLAMTVGIVAGLVCLPPLGRWLDRGARSSAVAASMLVRVVGVVVLVAASAGDVPLFTVAALLLGIGNQSWPAAHAALVATVSTGRLRDAALAAGRSVRNAGLGVGALLAATAVAGGPSALRVLAVASGAGYLAAGALAWSVRVAADPTRRQSADDGPTPGMGVLLLANVLYVFCLNVPEIAVPLVLVTQLHASPVWAAAVFVANTVLVVALQVPLTTWTARWSRGTVLAASGVVLAVSYLGFLFATGLGPAAVALVSVACTLGEILYAGSSTALVTALAPPALLGRALARFQLSTGFGLAVSPAAITALAAHGPAALWGTLAAGTAGASAAVWRERDRA